MKKFLLILCVALISQFSFSQTEVGIKGGINYSSNGELRQFGGLTGLDTLFSSDKKMGYHGGVFFQFGLGEIFYLRPEFIYSKTKSSFNDVDYNQNSLDGNLLVGFDLLNPLHFFAGPSFQHVLKSELGNISLDPDKNVNVAIDMGLGLDLGRIGAEIRYERGLSENEATFLEDLVDDGIGYTVDTRTEQLILSFLLEL